MGRKLISLMPSRLLHKNMLFDEIVRLVKAHESGEFACELTTLKCVHNAFLDLSYVRKQGFQYRCEECYRCGSK